MRPLPGDMLEYAAQDTMHLLQLRQRLEDALDKKGRLQWAPRGVRAARRNAVGRCGRGHGLPPHQGRARPDAARVGDPARTRRLARRRGEGARSQHVPRRRQRGPARRRARSARNCGGGGGRSRVCRGLVVSQHAKAIVDAVARGNGGARSGLAEVSARPALGARPGLRGSGQRAQVGARPARGANSNSTPVCSVRANDSRRSPDANRIRSRSWRTCPSAALAGGGARRASSSARCVTSACLTIRRTGRLDEASGGCRMADGGDRVRIGICILSAAFPALAVAAAPSHVAAQGRRARVTSHESRRRALRARAPVGTLTRRRCLANSAACGSRPSTTSTGRRSRDCRSRRRRRSCSRLLDHAARNPPERGHLPGASGGGRAVRRRRSSRGPCTSPDAMGARPIPTTIRSRLRSPKRTGAASSCTRGSIRIAPGSAAIAGRCRRVTSAAPCRPS